MSILYDCKINVHKCMGKLDPAVSDIFSLYVGSKTRFDDTA